jgi:cytochrome c556
MGNIKATIDGGGDPKSQAYAARGLARWARALPTMFPAGTAAVTPSRARPEIWANKGDFNAKAASFAAAATELAAAADSGDKEAFTAKWRATGATCGACHQLYQAPQPSSGG